MVCREFGKVGSWVDDGLFGGLFSVEGFLVENIGCLGWRVFSLIEADCFRSLVRVSLLCRGELV